MKSLSSGLESALTQARSAAQADALEVHSGHFGVMPHYDSEGRPRGWQGQAELVLSGQDFDRISQVAGRIEGLMVVGLVFDLSRQRREQLETQARLHAIERFRTRAAEIAQAFGFSGYTLRDVQVSSDGPLGMRPPLASMSVMSARASAPLPLEAGLTTVQVTVSGAVTLK